MLDEMIAVGVKEPGPTTASEASRELSVDLTPSAGAYGFSVPMIPGAREPGMLTTFRVHAVVFSGLPIAMDAVTTAARQREGGGAPNQRRPAGERSLSRDLWQRLQRFIGATPRS